MQEVDFPHDASVVARGTGTRRARVVAYTSFYLFGALGKNSQLGRLHAWKGGIAGQPYLEIVSLTRANMCQGDRGEVSYRGSRSLASAREPQANIFAHARMCQALTCPLRTNGSPWI